MFIETFKQQISIDSRPNNTEEATTVYNTVVDPNLALDLNAHL